MQLFNVIMLGILFQFDLLITVKTETSRQYFHIDYINSRSGLQQYMLHRGGDKAKSEDARLRQGFASMFKIDPENNVILTFTVIRYEPDKEDSHKVVMQLMAESTNWTRGKIVTEVKNVFRQPDSFLAKERDTGKRYHLLLMSKSRPCIAGYTQTNTGINVTWPVTYVQVPVHSLCNDVGKFDASRYAVRFCFLVRGKDDWAGRWSKNVDYTRCYRRTKPTPKPKPKRDSVCEVETKTNIIISAKNIESVSQQVLKLIVSGQEREVFFTRPVINCVVVMLQKMSMEVDTIPASSIASVNILSSINKLVACCASVLDRLTLYSFRRDIENVAARTPLQDGSFRFMSSDIALTVVSMTPSRAQDIEFYVDRSTYEIMGLKLFKGIVKTKEYESLYTRVIVQINCTPRSPSSLNNHSIYRIGVSLFKNSDLFGQMRNSSNTEIVSGVLSVIIPDEDIKRHVRNVILVYHDNITTTPAPPQCVSWNPSTFDNGQGEWEREGCYRFITKADTKMCHCKHIGNFALLPGTRIASLDVDMAAKETMAPFIITGSVIFSLFVMMALWTYELFRNLRVGIPYTILMNSWVALVMSCIIFLACLGLYTDSVLACKCLAVLLHCLLLSSVTLMAVEMLYIYIQAKAVSRVFIQQSLQKICIVGWVSPFLLDIIIFTFSFTFRASFINSKECWINIPIFHMTFVAPFVLVVVMYCINCVMAWHALKQPTNNFQTDSRKFEIARRLKGSVVVINLFILTWLFALLSVNTGILILSGLFAVFISLQGMFIFLYNCLLRPKARLQWKNMLKRLPQNKKASGTSTIEKENSIEFFTVGPVNTVIDKPRTQSQITSSSVDAFFPGT